jgi:diaminohydroxyphosphoribosylaminopyrimidine deaminase / 5-amino-6-(5-phosphoribosylamino)uracil reductase
VAAPDGSSRWISSRPARVDAHRLRAEHDAVLVGTGAARTDDPHLAVRHGVRGRPPLRVVLDARGTIVRPDSRVVDRAAPTLVVVSPSASLARLPEHVEVARVALGVDGRFDLRALLRELGRRGVRSVLLEGGPTLARAFLVAGLVDRVVAYVRPAILGAGRALLDLPGVRSIADLTTLRIESVERIGDDVRITCTVKRRPRATPTAPRTRGPAR